MTLTKEEKLMFANIACAMATGDLSEDGNIVNCSISRYDICTLANFLGKIADDDEANTTKAGQARQM